MVNSFELLKQKAVAISEIELKNLADLHTGEMRLFDLLNSCREYTKGNETETVLLLLRQLNTQMENTQRYHAVACAQHKSSVELTPHAEVIRHIETIHQSIVLVTTYVTNTHESLKRLTNSVQQILDACKT